MKRNSGGKGNRIGGMDDKNCRGEERREMYRGEVTKKDRKRERERKRKGAKEEGERARQREERKNSKR